MALWKVAVFEYMFFSVWVSKSRSEENIFYCLLVSLLLVWITHEVDEQGEGDPFHCSSSVASSLLNESDSLGAASYAHFQFVHKLSQFVNIFFSVLVSVGIKRDKA